MRNRWRCLLGPFYLALLGLLVGCPSRQNESGTGPTGTTERKSAKIGVTQIVSHPGIDAVRNGFMDRMAEAGYAQGQRVTYDFKNAQGDMSNTQKIAQTFVAESVDLIFAISTPSSQAVAKATKSIPIVFGAVTDPVSAGLVTSLDHPGGNITGTSDVWPYKAQIHLLQRLDPKVRRIGVVYNPGESNSAFAIGQIKRACKELGLQLVTASVDSSAGVYAAAKSLVGRVDAFYSSADNTVISAVESLVKVAQQAKLPCVAGESDSVKRGALATLGTNYYEVGRASGDLAIKILGGAKPGDLAVVRETKADLYINLKAAKAIGLKIPADLLKQAKEVYR